MTDFVLDNFKLYNPKYGKMISEYCYITSSIIRVKLTDGEVIEYDDRSHSIRRPTKYDGTESSWKKKFAYKLSDMMEDKRYNQYDLAEKCGVSQASINYYLTGNRMPSAYIVTKIAKALGCSVNYLMDFE